VGRCEFVFHISNELFTTPSSPVSVFAPVDSMQSEQARNDCKIAFLCGGLTVVVD